MNDTLNLLTAALEHLTDGFLIADDAGTIRFANQTAAEILGYSVAELRELPVLDLHHKGDSEAERAMIQRLQEEFEEALERGFSGTVQLRSKQGEVLPCDLNMRQFVVDDQRCYVCVFCRRAQLTEGEKLRLADENFLYNVVESFPMAVLVKDIDDDFRNIMVNQRYEEMFDVSREVIIGTTDYQLLPKEEADVINHYYREVVHGRDTLQGTVTPITTNRGRRYVRSFNDIMRHPDGRPQYILSVVEDRTDEVLRAREARTQRERMRKYLRVADSALMDIDAGGKIIEANEQVATACGVTQENLIGLDFRDMPFADDEHRLWVSLIGNALHGLQRAGITDTFEAALGGRYFRWKVLANQHLSRNEIFSVTVVGEDVTEIHERRIEAERANRSKSEFLANMSHELRTPLNAIIGYSEMLQEVADEDGREEEIGDLQRIIGAGRHLLGLINEILDLAKIESGKMEVDIEEVDLERMLEDVRSFGASLVINNGNELSVEGTAGALLFSDEMKLKQILLNLLANAAKFTRHGRISLHYEIDDAWAGFTVSDTGVGIPHEDQSRIFEAFTQADGSSTREFGGTGLGLAICKRFCEALGGSISVASNPGGGSAFRVVLPQGKPSETAARHALPDTAESTGNTR
jgi:PAS domain S-box-containing protein